MFSAKTETLIAQLRAAQRAGLSVLAYKSCCDDRYDPQDLATHAGDRFPALAVDDPRIALDAGSLPSVVGYDEAQFFGPVIVGAVQLLVADGIHVVVAGLDMTFDMEPYGQMGNLCAIADHITKTKARCWRCGAEAGLSWRDPAAGTERDIIGAADIYQARCRRCWKE